MHEAVLAQLKTFLEQQEVQRETFARLQQSAVERRDSDSPATWRDKEVRCRFIVHGFASVVQSVLYVVLGVVVEIAVADADR